MRAADDQSEFGHSGAGHRSHHLGPVLGDAFVLVLLADHEAGDVLQEQQGQAAPVRQLNEMGAFQGGFGEQNAVVGQNGHRQPLQASEAAHQGLAVEGLEFVKFAGIDQPGDQFAHIEGGARVLGQDAVDLLGVPSRGDRFLSQGRRPMAQRAGRDDFPSQGQGVRVVIRQIVRHAGAAAMHIAAAQGFGIYLLARGRLDQRRAAEEHSALIAHDDGLIAHGRHISAAGRAGTHHQGDLRNAGGGQIGLIVEDAAKILLVRKHLRLHGQIGAAGIHQIDARQAVLRGDFLGPQMLLHGDGVIGAALDRGIVGDDDAWLAGHPADAGDEAPGRQPVLIQLIARQRRDFQEGRTGVQQPFHPLPGQQLAARRMPGLGPLAAAGGDAGGQRPQLGGQGPVMLGVGAKRRRAGIQLALQQRHALASSSRAIALASGFRPAPAAAWRTARRSARR